MRLAVTLAGLALVAAAGCGTSGSETTGTAAAEPEQAAGGAGFPRTVEHVMGSTTIEAKPKTVVALDPSYIDNALLLDTEVVGYATYSADDKGLPDYLGPARDRLAGDAVSVGTTDQPNLEKIVELRPDLIVSAQIRHEDLYDELSKIAPTVMSETTGATWKQNIELLAEALGEQEKAKAELAAYEKRAAAIGADINAAANDPTISVVRFLTGETRLYQNESFIGVLLADAGLARPPSQDVDEFAAVISEELITDADADHIFVTTYDDGTDGGDQVREKFQRNPLWKQLKGEIHTVDDKLWMEPVSLQGAQAILDDLATIFDVDPHT